MTILLRAYLPRYVFLWIVFSIATVEQAVAAPFYREIFNVCDESETITQGAQKLAGWKAARAAARIAKGPILKLNIPGSADDLPAFNSRPLGNFDGAAFWTRETEGLTILTEEFGFDIARLRYVQYQQRLSGSGATGNDGTKLVFLINGTWFISDTVARQQARGAWQSVAWEPHQLTYGIWANRPGLGPREPKSKGVTLPATGFVAAFGVFLPQVTGRVRLDNYTLSDDSLSQSQMESIPQTGECPLIDDADESEEDFESDDESEEYSDEEETYEFCRGRAARPLGRVSISTLDKRAALRAVNSHAPRAVRDRAILALLFQNGLRVDNLVNVRIHDYYRTGSTSLFEGAGITKQTKALRPRVQRMLDAYLNLLDSSSGAPLFQHYDLKDENFMSAALCTADLKKIVSQRLKNARRSARVRYRG